VLEDGSLLMPDVKLRNILASQALLRIDFVPEEEKAAVYCAGGWKANSPREWKWRLSDL
jgi:hypothetical protein